MRIPFPERIPISRAAIFAAALFLIQMAEGTALYFSVGCVAFILIATLAFNTAGGLTRASGAYVFSYSMLVVIVGICYKAFLGEPAESNLMDPQTDIEVYLVGITAMLAAVIVSRRLSRKSGLLQNMLRESEMYRSSVGCMLFGAVAVFAFALMGDSAAQLIRTFAQLNQLIPLGILIGVIYEIHSSDGSRSLNIPIALGIVYVFSLGMTGFSKEGMLTPFYCWLLPVAALRYRLSAVQVFGVLLFVFVVFYYLAPYSQYGRNLVPENSTLEQRSAIAVQLLESPDETRRLYNAQVSEQLGGSEKWGGYYNKPQGFWDRLQFVSVDDSLIDLTQKGHKVVGLYPVYEAFINTVPRFFWHDKPAPVYGGNYYAHEMGGLAPDDTTTGISFSPTAEAFHMAKWVGVMVVAPILWLFLFVVFDSLLGDLRATPWGLLAMALISHVAPEGALTGMIHLLTFGAEILVFCAVFATRIAPIFAIPILGPDRKRTPRTFTIRHSR